MALTEQQRSAARRAAGRMLEKTYPTLTRELRRMYDDNPRYRVQWGKKYNARRTEQIRMDIAGQFPKQYSEFLKEEEAKYEQPSAHSE